MPIPEFRDGLLPPSEDGEPYSAYPEQVEARFTFTGDRRRAWLGFVALRDLIDWLIRDHENVSAAKWWLKDRFVTSALDVDEVSAVLIVPAHLREMTDARMMLMFRLLVHGNVARQHLHSVVLPVMIGGPSDIELLNRERSRCAKNRLHDGEELVDCGWIEVL